MATRRPARVGVEAGIPESVAAWFEGGEFPASPWAWSLLVNDAAEVQKARGWWRAWTASRPGAEVPEPGYLWLTGAVDPK